MKKTLIGLVSIAALGLSGCDDIHVSFGHGGSWGSGVKGSGKVATETREVGDFHALEAGGALHITLTVGPASSFKIEGEDNIIKQIKSEVKDGTLRIYTEKSINPSKDVNVTITAPKIDAIDISGASTLDGIGLSAKALDLGCSGASRMKLDGQADNAKVSFSGASEVDFSSIKIAKLEGEISGASKLKASGEVDDVDLEISGAGDVDLLKAPGKTAKLSLSGASNAKIVAPDGIQAELTGASNLKYKGGKNVSVQSSGGSNSETID